MMMIFYLRKTEIIASNKALIDAFGGNYVPPSNFHNEEALDYLVEIVEQGVLFGQLMYPTLGPLRKVSLLQNSSSSIIFQSSLTTGPLRFKNYFLFDSDKNLTYRSGLNITFESSLIFI